VVLAGRGGRLRRATRRSRALRRALQRDLLEDV
jgi:hypothetical protein